MDYVDRAKAFGAFFAILNPFTVLPVFLAMTEGYEASGQRFLAIKVTFASALMCGVILVLGDHSLHLFGITVDQFRIAGGVVLAKISWSMLNGSEIVSHHATATERDQMSELSAMALYPLTFPMMIGPGTISTLIVYSAHAKGPIDLLPVASMILTSPSATRASSVCS